jgi:hypothetical protein
MIVHAITGALSGVKALHCLLSLTNGQFHFYPYRQPSERTVQGSWEYLLMESAQARDEEKGARAGDDTVVIRRAAPAEVKVAAVENSNGHVKPETLARESNKPAAAPREMDLSDLGNGIVVVSTYDGKWNPVDGEQQ